MNGLRCLVRIALADPLEELWCLDLHELPPLAVDPIDTELNRQGIPVLLNTVRGEAVKGIEL